MVLKGAYDPVIFFLRMCSVGQSAISAQCLNTLLPGGAFLPPAAFKVRFLSVKDHDDIVSLNTTFITFTRDRKACSCIHPFLWKKPLRQSLYCVFGFFGNISASRPVVRVYDHFAPRCLWVQIPLRCNFACNQESATLEVCYVIQLFRVWQSRCIILLDARRLGRRDGRAYGQWQLCTAKVERVTWRCLVMLARATAYFFCNISESTGNWPH